MTPYYTSKQILYVDMDGVLCNYQAAYEEAKQNTPEIEYPQSTPGFFENILPIPGALSSVKQLVDSWELFVLSAPSTRNPHSYTEKRIWIEKQLGYSFAKRLILCPDKSLLKGHYLLDDHISGKGQENFEGEVLHFGSPKLPNWLAVLQYLTQKQEKRREKRRDRQCVEKETRRR